MTAERRITRRAAIGSGTAAGLMLWLPDGVRTADAASLRKVPVARAGAFDGVMSGDPTDRAITLWTRLAAEQSRLRVSVEVAKDEAFKQVVARQYVPLTLTRDHTAKVRIGGLAPDTRYWYRFATQTTHSDTGRTQTAPPPDSTRTIRLGYFSCQAYTAGYYGAYRKLLDLDPDFVICGGDYIYEQTYHADGYDHARADHTGANKDGFASTIADYREKYRLYRTDPDLRELHRLVPLVPQWDDHEVSDNYVGTVGDTPAVPPGDENKGNFAYDHKRVVAGWRAWHEYMPALRPGGLKGPDTYRIYRRLQFGRNVDLLMLDSRSYRDRQPSAANAGKPRKFLGTAQLAWLKESLAGSAAAWKIVANQVMIMPLGAAGAPLNTDSWDGYTQERSNLLGDIRAHGTKDVVFLTGDVHTYFAGTVLEQGSSGRPVAVEIVGGSTTSPGIAAALGLGSVGPVADVALQAANPWFNYANTSAHGFAVLEAAPGGLSAEFWGANDILTRAGSMAVKRIAGFSVVPGTPQLHRT